MTGVYRFPAMESVIYGRPFTDVLKEEVERAAAHAVDRCADSSKHRSCAGVAMYLLQAAAARLHEADTVATDALPGSLTNW